MILALQRKQVYSVKEFMEMQREKTKPVIKKIKNRKPYELIPLAVAPLLKSSPVFAQTAIEASVASKVATAFAPLIALIQGISYPIAMVVVLGGALYVMIGDRSKGFGMMQGAALGYVLVQMAPMFLDILVKSVGGI